MTSKSSPIRIVAQAARVVNASVARSGGVRATAHARSLRTLSQPRDKRIAAAQIWRTRISSIQRRSLSNEAEVKPTKVYDFEKVKAVAASPASPSKPLIIDVREPHEFAGGHIPGAINLPVQTQPDALFLNEEEFEDRFGTSKPKQGQELVFYCKAGVRSRAAAQFAVRNGYSSVGEYPGSWIDWVENGGEVGGKS